jgi:hypothetical protein
MSGSAFEVSLQAFELIVDRFAALLVHHPAEQQEHKFNQTLAAHVGFLSHASSPAQVFKAVFRLDVEALSGQADRRPSRRLPDRNDTLKIHPMPFFLRDTEEGLPTPSLSSMTSSLTTVRLHSSTFLLV